MKKKYEKPTFIFENFALKTSIASGCEVIAPLPTYDEGCGYPTRGGIIFAEGTQCNSYPQDSENNGFCYHVPINTNNLFNS